eukprot:3782678-Ditylum_brightwellii.AAC.2
MDDCCLTKRSMENTRVDDDNGDGVGNSDDSANKHLTHLSQAVDCCLTERGMQNKHVDDDNGGGVGDSVDNSDGSANKQFTHLKKWMIIV